MMALLGLPPSSNLYWVAFNGHDSLLDALDFIPDVDDDWPFGHRFDCIALSEMQCSKALFLSHETPIDMRLASLYLNLMLINVCLSNKLDEEILIL